MIALNGGIDEAIDYYLTKNVVLESHRIIESLKFVDNRIRINSVLVNGYESSVQTIPANQTKLKIELRGVALDDIKYDLMVVIKILLVCLWQH